MKPLLGAGVDPPQESHFWREHVRGQYSQPYSQKARSVRPLAINSVAACF